MKEGELIFSHRNLTFIIVPKSVLISVYFSPIDSPNESITVGLNSDVIPAMSFPDGLTSCMYRLRRFCLRYFMGERGRYLLCMVVVFFL